MRKAAESQGTGTGSMLDDMDVAGVGWTESCQALLGFSAVKRV